MKTSRLLSALVLLVGCRAAGSGTGGAAGRTDDAPQAASPARSCGLHPTPYLTDQGIGQLTVGVSVTDLRVRCRILSDTNVLNEEGVAERQLQVDLGADTVAADVDSGKVYRIAVEHSVYRTSDSLGVGTVLGRLARMPGVRGVEGEGGLFIRVPSHCGLSFRLNYEIGDMEHRQTWSQADLERLTTTVPVDLVLVVGCRGSASSGAP